MTKICLQRAETSVKSSWDILSIFYS